jgi:hypothetical protein
MDEERPQGPIIQFNDLNALGKAVFLGGLFTRFAAKAVDTAIRATAEVVVEARKAFRQGLDDNIEEAHILEETDERRRKA